MVAADVLPDAKSAPSRQHILKYSDTDDNNNDDNNHNEGISNDIYILNDDIKDIYIYIFIYK